MCHTCSGTMQASVFVVSPEGSSYLVAFYNKQGNWVYSNTLVLAVISNLCPTYSAVTKHLSTTQTLSHKPCHINYMPHKPCYTNYMPHKPCHTNYMPHKLYATQIMSHKPCHTNYMPHKLYATQIMPHKPCHTN
jgi:hypothetical protein